MLRNSGTGFPITIAVTGQWGAGKSSFMRLLEGEVKRKGYFPAWFNAWHDQNEENVLSSLLQAIRRQAIPRVFSLDFVRAIALRVNLLCSRGPIYVAAVMGLIFLVAATAFVVRDEFGDLPSWEEDVRPAMQASIGTYRPFYVTDAAVEAACHALSRHSLKSTERPNACKEQLGELKANRTGRIRWSNSSSLRKEVMDRVRNLPHPGYTVEVERALLDNVAHVATPSLRTVFGKLLPELTGGLWQWLTAFLATVIVIVNGASAFGFNLRRGVASFLNAAADSVEPAGRHEQLRRDFRTVSHSIGRRLVIFIDDLDRCQPGKVVETLEAVNFLVTAGECAVVMGMDYERVAQCVGLVRKELADAESAAAAANDIETERRIAYAHQYLKKLVNIEMPIPAERDRLKDLLVTPRQPAEQQAIWVRIQRALPWLWGFRVSPIMTAVVVSVVVIPLMLLGVPWVHGELVPSEPFEVVHTVPDDDTPPDSTGQQTHEQLTARLGDSERGPTTRRPPETTPEVAYWPVIVGLLMILIPGVLRAFRWLDERGGLKLPYRVVGLLRRLLDAPSVVHDSTAFAKALEIWTDSVVHDETTPREVKRFLNRLRYFAAMLHTQNGKGLTPRREVNLVALTALHHLGVALARISHQGDTGLKFQAPTGSNTARTV